jgi:hypothetical protein
MSGTQPPIDLSQLSSDITSLLTPTTSGVTPGYVLTYNGTTTLWSVSSSTTLAGLSDVTLVSPTSGQVLTYNGTVWTNSTASNSGTVTSIGLTSSSSALTVNGSGSTITSSGAWILTLGNELQNFEGITSSGTSASFVQRNTGSGAYTYYTLQSSDITTALGYTPYNGSSNPNGYITGNQTITLSGDATGSGTTSLPLTLKTVNSNTAGPYNTITVNGKGLVTAASNTSYLTTNQAITITGDVSGSGTTAITLTLASVNSNVGTFGTTSQIPTFTVNAKGLITAAGNVALTRPIFTSTAQGEVPASGGGTANFLRADATWSSPSGGTGSVTSVAATAGTGMAVTGSPITTTGTLAFSLSAELQGVNVLSSGGTGIVQRTGVSTYTAANLTTLQITTALGYTPVSTVTTINTTSPLIGGQNLATNPTLSILAFNGTQNGYVVKNTSLLNQFLRDDGSWQSVSGGSGSVTSVSSSGGTTGLTLTTATATTTPAITLAGTLGLANGGTGQITANAALNALLPSQTGNAGQVLTTNGTNTNWSATAATGVLSFNTRTGAVTLTLTDVTTALGYTPLQNNQIVSLTGDATGSSPGAGNNTITTTLATVNTNVGTFGTATSVPGITVNAKGLVTAVTSNTITPAGIGAATTTGSNATGTWPISITGTAGTATTSTKLTTADVSTNATMYPLFTTGINGSTAVDTSSTNYTFNPSTGTLFATTFNGAFTGNGANLTNVPTTALTGLLQAANFPALTGPVTVTSGTLVTAISNSGVTAGSYTNSNITVGADGRITAASTGSGGGGGSITQVTSSGNGIVVTNSTGPVVTLALASIPNTALTNSSVTVSSGIGLSGGGSVALGGTITLTNTGVTSAVAGSGINISTATGAVTFSNSGILVINGTANQIITSTTSGTTTIGFVPTGTVFPLPTSGSSPSVTITGSSTYPSVNLIGGALQLNGSNGVAGQVLTSAGAGTLPTWSTLITGVSSITAGGAGISTSSTTGAVIIQNTGVTSAIGTSGNITVSAATGAVTLNLATVGTAGTYSSVTTDAYGRVVSGTTTTATTSLTGVLQAAQFPALTGDITTTAGSLVTTLATVNTNVGQFSTVTVNAKGLVTAAKNITGDLTTTAGVATLATVNTNIGTFGSTSAIPIITVNAKGLVTAVTTATIGGGSGTVTSVAATGGTGISVSGSPITTSGTLTITNTGVTGITGTANQVIASAGTGSITLSLPQSIGTASNPTFSTVTFGSGTTIGATPATYGSTVVSGVNGGYAGFAFTSTTNNRTFMVSTAGTISGVYAQSASTWDWYFSSGVLTVGTVPGGSVTGAVASATTSTNLSGGTVAATSGSFSGNVLISGGLGVGTSAIGTGYIVATQDIEAFYSDMRLKTIVGPLDNALEKVNSLTGFKFKSNETAQVLGYDGDIVHIGVSAQEVEKILPEIIRSAPINGNIEGGGDYKTLNYSKLVPLLIEAIKELTTKVNVLEKQLEKK